MAHDGIGATLREDETVTWSPRFRHLVYGFIIVWALMFFFAAPLLLSRIDDDTARSQAALAAYLISGVTLMFIVGLFGMLYRFVFRPLNLLAREIHIIASVNPGHQIELPRDHLLGEVPDVVNDLGEAFLRATREVAEAASVTSGELESSKARLEDILMSLREGIIVCDDNSRIVFYNPAARGIFKESVALGLGRSLYLLCAAAPIENSLEILRQRKVRRRREAGEDDDVSFVCATLQGSILNCRMRLLPSVPGMPWSFLLTCEDISEDVETHNRRESLLRTTVKNMRQPLANLRVAVESLDLLPDLGSEEREALERGIADEARTVAGQFTVLAQEVQELESPIYPLRDVLSEDLLFFVARKLKNRGLDLTMIGDPLWVRADMHSLLFLLEYFAWSIHEHIGAAAIEVETLLGDKRVYFALCWQGTMISQSTIQKWVKAEVPLAGGDTVADVLERHGSEVWSKAHATPGFAVLYLPMPPSPRQWSEPRKLLPNRPVYVDFAIPEVIIDDEKLKELPLESVTFVVFDTETTGLSPLEGDEIVSIAGVKVIRKGIIIGETFDRIVNPRRDIPASSVRFHGITDQMVRTMPPIEKVLHEFHLFAGNAVLVGHNAAFDLRFMKMKEKAAGVTFDAPVVDTLALSRYLHDHTPEHSLDAIARRHGIDIRDRHTALGDSLITAKVFIKFLYLLEQRGTTTLGKLLEVSRR